MCGDSPLSLLSFNHTPIESLKYIKRAECNRPFRSHLIYIVRVLAANAPLMAAMLRSQGIPTRLEIGYSKDAYHAWVSVYIEDIGWIDSIIE